MGRWSLAHEFGSEGRQNLAARHMCPYVLGRDLHDLTEHNSSGSNCQSNIKHHLSLFFFPRDQMDFCLY